MKKHYNLLVAGGGMSGVAAAIAAAREGLSVLLVECTAFWAVWRLPDWSIPLCAIGCGRKILIQKGGIFSARAFSPKF